MKELHLGVALGGHQAEIEEAMMAMIGEQRSE